MKSLLISAVLFVLAFTAVTYIALESGDVVVVGTIDARTSAHRETHVWFVVDGDRLLLEAGNPKNPWVDDLTGMSKLHLSGEGLDGEYLFSFSEATSHDEIRLLMRRKYGWRDWWIDLLFDTSLSAAVEVTRVAP